MEINNKGFTEGKVGDLAKAELVNAVGKDVLPARRDIIKDIKLERFTPTGVIRPSGSIDMSGMTLIRQNSNILFPGGSNAKISLYARVSRDVDGSFMFDDGQDWLLLFETSAGIYPLFPRKYVQLGMVNYSVFIAYKGADEIFHVLVTSEWSAGYEIYDCIYDARLKVFRVSPVYNSSGINPIASSFQPFER